jgi:hypothetical protein
VIALAPRRSKWLVLGHCDEVPRRPQLTRSRLSRMAALVRGDDRQILFMLSERYESHAASQIRCRELGLTLTLEGKGAL